MSETTPDPADVHTGTDRVELTDAEKWLIPHLTQLDAAADARDVYAAVESIVAARVQALTAERDNFEANCAHWMKSYEQQTEFARQMTGERDAARAELASANARLESVFAQLMQQREERHHRESERDALQATLDRISALADEWTTPIANWLRSAYNVQDDSPTAEDVSNERLAAAQRMTKMRDDLRAALRKPRGLDSRGRSILNPNYGIDDEGGVSDEHR